MSVEHKTTEPGADRRRWLIGIVSALGGASVLALATTYLRSPSRAYAKTVRIGPVDDVFRDRTTRMITINDEPIALIRDPNSSSISAMSMQCTHSGCPLEFHDNRFHCHCHGGAFDLGGVPVAGPPKRPLRQYAVFVDGTELFLRVGSSFGSAL